MRRGATIIGAAVVALLMVTGSPNAAQENTPESSSPLPHPLISDNFSYDLPDIFWSADGQQLYVAEDQFAWNPLFYAYSLITRDLTFIKSGRDAYLPTVTDAERAEYDMDSVDSADVSQRYIVYGTGERQVSRHLRLPKMRVLDRETAATHPIINVEWNWETAAPELGNPYNLSFFGVELWGQNGGGFVMRFNPPYGGTDPLWRWVSGYAAGKMTRAIPLINLKVREEFVTPYQVYAVSADSTRLLMAVSGRRLVVWYPDDPDASYIVPGISAETINNAAFYPVDPEQIVAIGQKGLFYIELETGEVTMLHEGVVQEHRAFVAGSAFSPDGTWLAFQNLDADQREKQGVYLYNVLTNTFDSGHKPIHSISTYADSDTVESHGLRALGWEGEWIAAGGEYGIRVYSADDLTSPVFDIPTSSQIRMSHMALDMDARLIVLGDHDGGVWLWRDGNLQIVHKFDYSVFSIALSPDGSQLAASGGDSQLLLFDLTKAGVTPLDLGKRYGVVSGAQVAFTPDRKLWVYAKAYPESYRDEDPLYEERQNLPFVWVKGDAEGDAISFGAERYVEYTPHVLTVYDYRRNGVVRQISSEMERTYFPAHDANPLLEINSRYVAFVVDQYSGSDRNIMLWDTLDEHSPITILSMSGDAPRRLAFSPDGTRLASLTWDGMLHIWELPHAQTENPSAGE